MGDESDVMVRYLIVGIPGVWKSSDFRQLDLCII